MSHTMTEYDTLRQKHVEDAVRLLPEHLQRLDWPGERLQAERAHRLRDLVRVAKEGSEWHRQRLADVDPDELREDDLQRLPVMTKDDLMANWDDIVTDRRLTLDMVEAHIESLTTDAYLLDRYHAIASGGSSGRRGVFVCGWDAWTLCYLGMVRWSVRQAMRNPELGAALPVAASISARAASHKMSAIVQTFANPSLPIYHLAVSLPMQEIVAGLNELQPTYLLGYPSVLYELAHEARKGNLRISPAGVSANSEPLWPEIRSALEATWGAPVGNVWGTSEGGPAGVSCGQGAGMHLADDLLIIEPVDEEGRLVPAGVRGAKVYLTNLYRPTLPLIRYEITDEVTVLAEPCPCGSAFSRVDDVQGRLDESFTYEGGITAHPLIFRSPLSREPNVLEYQVRQTRKGAEIAVRCVGKVDMSGLRGKLADELVELGLNDPEISVIAVERFGRTAVGKLKRFIPLPRE